MIDSGEKRISLEIGSKKVYLLPIREGPTRIHKSALSELIESKAACGQAVVAHAFNPQHSGGREAGRSPSIQSKFQDN